MAADSDSPWSLVTDASVCLKVGEPSRSSRLPSLQIPNNDVLRAESAAHIDGRSPKGADDTRCPGSLVVRHSGCPLEAADNRRPG